MKYKLFKQNKQLSIGSIWKLKSLLSNEIVTFYTCPKKNLAENIDETKKHIFLLIDIKENNMFNHDTCYVFYSITTQETFYLDLNYDVKKCLELYK